MNFASRRALSALAAILAVAPVTVATAAAGRTPGSASVSPSGAAHYSIPLWTPPGIRGLAPSLALVYSSNAGDGLAGRGFTLAYGQSQIARCDQTIAQDGGNQAASLATTDKFCLDGNRLRLTGGTYGSAGSTYQTEIETYSRVTANGTAGNGPQWFEVKGKDGLIYEYGNSTDSRIESVTDAGGQTTTIRAWPISKVRDRFGNAIKFKYVDDTTNGSFRPDEITWAGNSNTGLADKYKIKFVYEAVSRPDPLYGYLYGNSTGVSGRINEYKRLDRIDVTRETPSSTLLRRYELTFDPSGGLSGRSRLQSIQECGGSSGTDCLAATTFTWQNGTAGIASSAASSGQTMPSGVMPLPIDINGDGRDDIVWSSSATPGAGTWYYMLASPAGGYSAAVNTGITSYGSAYPIQWDGDDKWDLLVSYGGSTWFVMVANGSGFNAPSNTGVTLTAGNFWVADIDGDGRGDLIRAANEGGYGKVYVRLRTGSGFAATETLAIDMAGWDMGGETFTVWGSVPFGYLSDKFRSADRNPDFDGDGREDFILSTNRYIVETGQNTRMLYIILGRDNGLVTGDVFGGLTSLYDWRYGDFNGDGKTDIGYANGTTFYYAFSKGTSLFVTTSSITNTASPRIIMDWDGDGKDDLVTAKGSPTT